MIILPIDDAETLRKVTEAAHADGDVILWPSHYAIKDGEIVGAFALETPTANWWLHREKVKIRDSLQMLNTMDALYADRGRKAYIMPTVKTTPYWNILERAGFTKLPEEVHFFLRTLDDHTSDDS